MPAGRAVRTLLTACCLTGFLQGALAATSGTYSLGPATISGNVAAFDVSLDFTGEGGEELVFFAVDVSASDTALTGGGTDYSAFSFQKASPLLDGWDQLGTFALGPSADFQTLTAPLGTGLYALGTLELDLAATGLGPGDAFTVSLAGGWKDALGVEPPGQPNLFHFVDAGFDPASQEATVPYDEADIIPEPLTSTLAVLALAGLAGYVRKRRAA